MPYVEISPAQPPLPMPMNLPFQLAAGIQTSILISESAAGLITAFTLQEAGVRATDAALGAANTEPGAAVRPRNTVGGANSPTPTASTLITVVSGSFSCSSFAQ